MWLAQVRAIVLDNAWKVCFVILSIQYFYCARGCIACTYWLLGKARIKFKCPGTARFEQQIVDVAHRQEGFINGDGLFFEVQHGTYIMLGFLANNYVVQRRWASSGVFRYIRVQPFYAQNTLQRRA